ncbi:MAG: hypothetical protein RR946_03270 [Clostridia bacterium]
MAGIGNQMKLALLKGMEAIGKSASSMAGSAQQKLAEINLETRRREILSDFPMRAFDLWQKGTELPEPLGTLLSELSDLDERLSLLRAQRYAKVESKNTDTAEDAAEDAASSDAEAADAEAVQEDASAEASDPTDEFSSEGEPALSEEPASISNEQVEACAPVADEAQPLACESPKEEGTGGNA